MTRPVYFLTACIAAAIFHTTGGVGESCQDVTNCTRENEACVEGFCTCAVNFKDQNGICVEGGVGESCQDVTNCTRENEACVEGFCTCAVNFKDQNGICVEDFCVTQPCQETALDCALDNGTKFCVCPEGFRGPDCAQDDLPLECRRRRKIVYYDLSTEQPSVENRTACLPKMDTTSNNSCHNPDGGIAYQFAGDNIVTIDDRPISFCLIENIVTPDVPEYCVNVTAFQEEDKGYRPWVNDTTELCFVYNRPPRFVAPTPTSKLHYNLPDMGDSVTVTLGVSENDVHQTTTISILDVTPQEFQSIFNIQGTSLLISRPDTTNDNVKVRLKIEDNGIPILSNEKNISMTFRNETLVCDVSQDTFLVHLVPPLESALPLGQITCPGYSAENGLQFQIQGDPSPAIINDVGGISYDPNTEIPAGTFPVVVRATVQGTINLTTTISFEIIAGDLSPSCTLGPSGSEEAFSELVDIGSCTQAVYTCMSLGNTTLTCNDQSSEFDVECQQNINGVTVKFCTAVSLRNMVGVFMVDANVTNSYGMDTVQVNVTVNNVNDGPTLQVNASQLLNLGISRSAAVGDIVVEIPVADPDIDLPDVVDSLTVSLTDMESVEVPFFMATLSSDQRTVTVSVARSLVSESQPTYSLSLEVTDIGGLSDAVNLVINVEAVNLFPPACDPDTLAVTISVRQAVGTVVASVACKDPDTSSLFNTITYSLIQNEDPGYFQVNSVTGAVTLAQSLVNVTGSGVVFELVVLATDGGDLQDNVTITVSVDNSYPPECVNPVLSDTLSELTEQGVCFTLPSGCTDPVQNSALSFSLTSGNGTQLFQLNQNADVNTVSICTIVPLRNQYGKWVLSGSVKSDYGETSLSVAVTVSDINDPPMFVNPDSYVINVNESIPVGSRVLTVSAADPDSGVFGIVTYHSQASGGLEDSAFFTLSRTTGEISVKSQLDYDGNLPNTYRFEISAIDGAPEPKSAVAIVVINVMDVNDNPPTCSTGSDEIIIPVTQDVDSVVYQLVCSDSDKSPQFKTLQYNIGPASDYFSVNESGVVTLTSKLPITPENYVLDITVNDGVYYFDVNLTINIDTNIPPVCTPASIERVIQESRPIGGCLDKEVVCSDPVGNNVTFSSGIGSGSNLLEIRYSPLSSGRLGLNACIKTSIKNKFGTYELIGTVTNGLATTVINWTFTVTNVNEQPVFITDVYNASISEATESNEALLVISVMDPDDPFSDEIFKLKSLTARLTNNADFNNALSNTILFVEGARTFFATRPMNATIRDLYTYEVIATDGLGLSSTSRVDITVIDVNEPPFCIPAQISVETNVLAEEGTEVVQLSCYDMDKTPLNTALSYSIISGNDGGYFNVTNTGSIVLIQAFPRIGVGADGIARLSVLVSDSGTPVGQATATASITVDNKIAAECKPVITPPDIWVINKAATITMDCTDPTTSDNGHLSYSTSGNFTSGFQIESNSKGTIVLRYTQVVSGYYQITVRVDNGLKPYLFTEVIVVSYEQAAPVFSIPKYTTSITEQISVGSSVLRVEAVSQNLIGNLVYIVVDDESFTDWKNYFAFDTSSGAFTTKLSLTPLANQNVTLKVEAEDTGSRLRSTTQVEIEVLDVNEAPQCSITARNYVDLPVGSAVGTLILSFSCTDPDVKAEFRQLNYNLEGNLVSSYFRLTEDQDADPTALVIRAPLEVNTDVYSVRLTVSDSAPTPLSFIEAFDVTVNLLPPRVIISARAIGFDVIEVSWSYERNAFYDVTNGFRVILNPPSPETMLQSSALQKTVSSHNMTGLKPNTRYSVVVRANTTYGFRDSNRISVTTTEVPVLSKFTATFISKTDNYDPRLRDPESYIFITTRSKILNNMEAVLRDTQGYAGTTLKSFRPANSIKVDAVVAVNQSGIVSNTVDALNDSVSTGWLNSLSVDSGYFVASLGEGYILINSISTNPTAVYNGSSVTISCNIETVGFLSETAFNYSWRYNNSIITPTSTSRYSTSYTESRDVPENKLSELSIDPVLSYHSGTYTCTSSLADGTQYQEKTLTLSVTTQPTVTLTPRSLTVNEGSGVNLTCQLTPESARQVSFVWYRNGALLQQQSGEQIQTDTDSETLIISSLTQSVVFGCQGENEAGKGPLISSHIGVIPRAAASTDICRRTTDGRGTVWSDAIPGTLSILNCDVNYVGEISRFCNSDGIWETPTYNCVKETLTSLTERIGLLGDGFGGDNTSELLEELVSVTDDADLYEAEVAVTLDALDAIAGAATNVDDAPNVVTEDVENFLQTASNVIDERNKPSWVARIESSDEGAIDVPKVVESYLDRRLDDTYFDSNTLVKTFTVKNIYAEVGLSDSQTSKYEFPGRSSNTPTWVRETTTGISVSAQALKDLPSFKFGGAFFRNITNILVRKLKKDGLIEDVGDKYNINSDIVSFQVQGLGSKTVDPPAVITFQHFDSNYSNPICCFWNFDISAFDTEGCSVRSTSEDKTECECNHFTNFAILMSPGRTPEAHVLPMSIISAVGCAISIFCLLITIVLYLLVWRLVKSDRAVLLLNLCVALIISYIIFLAGVSRAENKDLCTAISALLHYFFLAVFFLMLAYGVEIAISVIYVFVTRSRNKYLLPLAWGIPLIIVAISMGATQLEGYGNDTFCWLSIESNLLWAFVIPAAVVIVINLFIVVAVLRKMFQTTAMVTKSDKEKAKTGVRSLCVLLPILGLTWVFGVFSVNEDLVIFQYLFAVFNSLQGFFIFLFHCVLNNQLREALKKRSARKKSLASFESQYKQQHSQSTDLETATSGVSKQNNEQSDQTRTNPFLEADRQVKELEAKKKKGANLFNKGTYDKAPDKANNAVDLEDVKISNILRESEVMGGTTGISSILQTETQGGVQPTTQHTTTESSVNKTPQKWAMHDKYNNPDVNKAQAKSSSYEKLSKPTKQTQDPYTKLAFGSDTKGKEKKQKQKEQEERTRSKTQEPMQIKVGYGYNEGKSRDNSGKQTKTSSRSSRSDDDREGQGMSSSQNITSISTAIPTKYDPYIGQKRQPEAKKKERDRQKKRPSVRDRSRDYEYMYESAYLGNSRHASLEDVNAQNYPYSQYMQMPVMGGYPPQAHQPAQHPWDPYRQYHDPYRGDYW